MDDLLGLMGDVGGVSMPAAAAVPQMGLGGGLEDLLGGLGLGGGSERSLQIA